MTDDATSGGPPGSGGEEPTRAGESAFLQPTLAAALDASLVLEALGIPHSLRSVEGEAGREGTWAVFVAEAHADRAAAAMEEVAREEAAHEPRAAPAAEDGGSALGPVVALLVIGFSTYVGPRDGSVSWFARGSADAARVVSGEWWRAITALTLHADAGHAGGNAIALGFLLSALAGRLGTGLAAWLPLLAGIAGNWLTAQAVRAPYQSVGASTAVFGALGILSALQAPGKRAWLTLGAGLALLGFLGTGARSDLVAHLFGFLCGALLGAAARALVPPRRTLFQPLAAALALVPLAAAWLRAFRPPGV